MRLYFLRCGMRSRPFMRLGCVPALGSLEIPLNPYIKFPFCLMGYSLQRWPPLTSSFPGCISHSSRRRWDLFLLSNRLQWSDALPVLGLAVKNPGDFHPCSLGSQLPCKGAWARLLNKERFRGERGAMQSALRHRQRIGAFLALPVQPSHPLNAVEWVTPGYATWSKNQPSRALSKFLTHRIMKKSILLMLVVSKFWVVCYAVIDNRNHLAGTNSFSCKPSVLTSIENLQQSGHAK